MGKVKCLQVGLRAELASGHPEPKAVSKSALNGSWALGISDLSKAFGT
jgi:hypothetical protein